MFLMEPKYYLVIFQNFTSVIGFYFNAEIQLFLLVYYSANASQYHFISPAQKETKNKKQKQQQQQTMDMHSLLFIQGSITDPPPPHFLGSAGPQGLCVGGICLADRLLKRSRKRGQQLPAGQLLWSCCSQAIYTS